MPALAVKKTEVEVLAEEFADEFGKIAKELRKSMEAKSVNRNFFEDSDKGNGFLSDFLMCLRRNGYHLMVERISPKLTANGSLPLHDFAEGIARLSDKQLKSLKSFHQKMEEVDETSGRQGFPDNYREIGKYFETHERSSMHSAEAGRLVMLVSAMAGRMIELRFVIRNYQPRIEEKIGDSIPELDQEIDREELAEMDSAGRALDIVLQKIQIPELRIQEITDLTKAMQEHKVRLLEFIVKNAEALQETNKNKYHAANRNIKAWIDLEELAVNKSDGGSAVIEPIDFPPEFLAFKKKVIEQLKIYERLCRKVQECLFQQSSVSDYFANVLMEIKDLLDMIADSDIPMDPELRAYINKLNSLIHNTTEYHKRVLEKEKRESDRLPEIVPKRIRYLCVEVPRVLVRSNPKEVKYMTLAINASYKNIEKSLISHFAKERIETDVRKCCSVMRRRFSEIIRTAILLVKQN